MKVGLVDIDSKIPNLALMKISAWHKNLGCDVELTSPLFAHQYDHIFASKVFDYTEAPVLPNGTVCGGSGFDLKSSLALNFPEDIENIYPDYGLYGCDYAMGFTTRGCNRQCPFCLVPKMEGKFRVVGEITDFWDGQEYLMLLDNSLNTDEQHFSLVCGFLRHNNIKTDFNQGLDIRRLTDYQALCLSSVPLWKQIHFAWDNVSFEKSVKKGIDLLIKHGLKNKSMVYVLIGFDSAPEEDLHRVEKLREWGIDPFAMPYNKFNDYQRQFSRWVNHKAIFKSVKWEDYRP